jgi:hypothetical protein
MLFGYDKRVTTEVGTDLLGRYRSFALCATMLLVVSCGSSIVEAQQPAPSGPQPSTNSKPPPADSVQPKNDRIFGVVPNYRTIENPNIRMAPLSAKGKFKLALEDSFDPYAYVIAGAFAGFGQSKNNPKSWGEESWGPFTKRYAASFADQTSENFMTEAVVPWLLKEDPRYFRLGTGGFFKRTGYAVSRIWVTQTDAGHRTFNFSEILGAGASAGISNFYYPKENRTLSNNLSQWGVMVGEDTFFNLLKEYWPDIHQKMFKRFHRPSLSF